MRPNSAPAGAAEDIKKRSLIQLITSLPQLLKTLLTEEVQRLKNEMLRKLKHAGIGIGLVAFAALVISVTMLVLIAAAILGFATIVPAWLAALIVAGILIVIAAVVGLIGVTQLKRAVPPAPKETIMSVRKDINAIKGIHPSNSAPAQSNSETQNLKPATQGEHRWGKNA